MSKIKLPALMKNFDTIMTRVRSEAVAAGFNKSTIYKLILAAEEVITNIIKYAYPSENGNIEISCEKNNNIFTVIVKDQGIPFNPLEKGSPDIKQDVEDRPIGGLGIHLIKQVMDEVSYERKNNTNILMFSKKITLENSSKSGTEKKEKQHSDEKKLRLKLKPKIMIIMLCLTICSLTVLGSISIILINWLLKDTSRELKTVVLNKNKESINLIVNEEALNTKNILQTIENEISLLTDSFQWNSYSQIISSMNSIKKNMNYVSDFYFSDKNGNFYSIHDDESLPDDYNPLIREWYVNAIKSENVTWTGVYNDAATNELIITCSKKFIDKNGNPGGVLACDVTVDVVNEIINNIGIEDTGYSFLIDAQGNLLASPKINNSKNTNDEILKTEPGNSLFNSKNENFKNAITQMINNKNGYITWNEPDQSRKIIAYETVSQANWTLGFVIDENDVTEEVTKEINDLKYKHIKNILIFFLILFLLLILSVVLISINLANRIVNPILELVKGTELVSTGDLNYEIKTNTGDELELLGDRFNSMAMNLKTYISNLQKVTAEKKKIETEISILNTLQTEILPGLSNKNEELPEKIETFDWLIPYMQKEEYNKGDILFKKEDNANSIYYLDKGLLKFEEINVECKEKTLIGETGIFSPDNKRTATAVFLNDSQIYSMINEKIKELVPKFPMLLVNLISLSIKRTLSNLSRTLEAKQLIENELKVASKIQADMLPGVFPPFPERKEFDIFASMKPAKDVGGDFYDFFFINDDKLAFVIADVSGKGIPAALFMVISKTLIKTEAMHNKPPADVLYRVNNLLCEENDEFMFVTVFLCIINLKTGELQYSNAGHNPPLFSQNKNDFEYIKLEKTKVVGVFEDYKYTNNTIQLNPGDKIFMYTDGVTEAMNKESKQFSDARLKNDLIGMKDKSITDIEKKIKLSIEKFVNGASQSDDITMVVFEYNGE